MESGHAAALTLRDARPQEAAMLSALAFRSKAHWGYPQDFMQACRGELTYAEADVARGGFVVAEAGGRIVGFTALAAGADGAVAVEALFVEPREIGRGIGRALIDHAKRRAARLGARRLVIQGDPHAEGFYLKAGARHAGARPSGSIPGRMLPVFAIELASEKSG